jgi:dipeptidyl aminopeptidase/acylaminoacyl peptidase
MRLVYTGTDGALYAWERAGAAATRLTWAWEEPVADGPPEGLCYGWPTASGDGHRILTLARRGRDHHFVYLVDTSGVVAEEIVALGDAAPIYANWSPDGSRIAILVQRNDTLALEIVDLDGERRPRAVAHGAPLFWSWAPDGRHLAVHCGQSARDMSAGGTLLIDADGGRVDEVLSGVPALYRAPAWSADGRWLAFARVAERGTRLVMLDVASGERCTRELDPGPVAFIWHPCLPLLAYVVAPLDAPHVYHRVVLLDLRADREQAITRPTLACAWHPRDAVLFRLAIDDRREALSWERHDAPDTAVPITHFVPTREIVFAASFFDQYASSHGPVAPDGKSLAIAGRLIDDAETKDPRVYVIPADAKGPAVAVGPGVYPVWAR